MAEEILLYITQGTNKSVRNLETLMETNDLTIGQVFHSVANFYSKTKEDYPRWISYRNNPGEFHTFKGIVDELETDLEKIHLVCEWLGEDLI